MTARIPALPILRAQTSSQTLQNSALVSISYATGSLAEHLQYLDEKALPAGAPGWLGTPYGGSMLRVEIHDSANTVRLKFEGRFTGDDAQNTCTLITRCFDGMGLLVDITDVTFIDYAGEEVLSFFGRFGAEFVAETSYTLDVCERLHLRLARSGASDPNPSGPSHPNASRRRRHKRQTENEEV
jgi:hypothetical protein